MDEIQSQLGKVVKGGTRVLSQMYYGFPGNDLSVSS